MSDDRYDDITPKLPNGRLDMAAIAVLLRKIHASFVFLVVNFCWIENKTEDGAVTGESKFNLWPAQRRVCPKFIRHRLLVILKARQLGLTWLTAAYCLWRVLTRPGYLAVVISAKEGWAKEFLDRVKFMEQRLPHWLRMELSADSTEHMRFVYEWDRDGKKAKIYSDIKSLTTTQEGAQSKTPDLLVMDETARNRYASEIFGASKPGIDKAGGQIIVISNSHKRGPGWPWTRDICSAALKGQNAFHFIFMPWWDCPERVAEQEKALMRENPNFRPKHFKAQLIAGGEDPVDVKENYPDTPEEALEAAQGSYFEDSLSRHSRSTFRGLRGTLYRKRDKSLYFHVAKQQDQATGPNILSIWRYPYFLTDSWNGQYWTGRYCIGSDISEGLGKSYSVAYVMDRRHDELVARLRANRVDAVDWAKYLNLLSRYYCDFRLGEDGRSIAKEPALICVERTGAGLTTVKELEKVNANQFVRIAHGKRGAQDTDTIGWHEDRQSKHILCGDLKNWFKTMRGHIYCRVLVDEAATTIEHENGALGPEKGKMWDTVVGAGCTLQASNQLGAPPQKLKLIEHHERPGQQSMWAV